MNVYKIGWKKYIIHFEQEFFKNGEIEDMIIKLEDTFPNSTFFIISGKK